VDPLDGNAIGGALLEYFGTEMTMARGCCAHCGAVSRIAELRVYAKAPGAVARCRACGGVVLVVVERQAGSEVRVDAFELAG
jgi:Family of unknown function (DUF6510)